MAKSSSLKLDELVAELSRVYGGGLRSIVLYGSAASGEQVEGRSDHNVLVIVDRIDPSRLHQMAEMSRVWMEAGNPLPLCQQSPPSSMVEQLDSRKALRVKPHLL